MSQDSHRLPDTLDEVLAASTSARSHLHGEPHWRRVASHGLALAARTPGADPLVAVLFGMFHDSMRWNDGHDPAHGRRGGELARRLNGTLGLEEDRLSLLDRACADHTGGGLSPDPTIGACWDSDRLDLVRLRITPDRRPLSTVAARDSEAFERATALLRSTPEWPAIFERLAELEQG